MNLPTSRHLRFQCFPNGHPSRNMAAITDRDRVYLRQQQTAVHGRPACTPSCIVFQANRSKVTNHSGASAASALLFNPPSPLRSPKMNTVRRVLGIMLAVVTLMIGGGQVEAQSVKEKAFDAPHNVKIKVRMEGPYTADVPLQIVCYF